MFQQLNNFLALNSCFDVLQSGFRPHHSTETALIKVFNDIRLNRDSAAFDTVNHNILLDGPENWVELSGTALS